MGRCTTTGCVSCGIVACSGVLVAFFLWCTPAQMDTQGLRRSVRREDDEGSRGGEGGTTPSQATSLPETVGHRDRSDAAPKAKQRQWQRPRTAANWTRHPSQCQRPWAPRQVGRGTQSQATPVAETAHRSKPDAVPEPVNTSGRDRGAPRQVGRGTQSQATPVAETLLTATRVGDNPTTGVCRFAPSVFAPARDHAHLCRKGHSLRGPERQQQTAPKRSARH